LPVPGAPGLFVGSSASFNTPADAEQMQNETDKYPAMIIHIENLQKNGKLP